VIGTRTVGCTGTSWDNGEGGSGISYSGYNNTYYDNSGKVIKQGKENLGKLSATESARLADVFQGKAVYTRSVQTTNSVGGYHDSGYTEYYDENLNLLGKQGWDRRYIYNVGYTTTYGGFQDKNGTQITAGTPQWMSNGGTQLINTGTTTRTITAGSEEDTKLKEIFGVVPASAHEFYQSYMWDGRYQNGNTSPQWVSKGLITTYYDKDGNFLGSSLGGKWFDRNGDEISW
jgi:hypothetical protein